MGEEEGVATRGDRGGAASVGGEPWLEPAWRRLQANAKSFVPECSLTRQMPSPLPSYLARHRSAHASERVMARASGAAALLRRLDIVRVSVRSELQSTLRRVIYRVLGIGTRAASNQVSKRRRRSAPRSRHAHEFTRVHEHAQDDTRACTRELAGRRSERPRLSIGLLVTLRGGRGPLDPLTAAAAHGERGPSEERCPDLDLGCPRSETGRLCTRQSSRGAVPALASAPEPTDVPDEHRRRTTKRNWTSPLHPSYRAALLASADYRFAYRSLRSAARRSAISGGGNVSRAS
ncbi:unnamed protein product [Lampetra fluviatilis]